MSNNDTGWKGSEHLDQEPQPLQVESLAKQEGGVACVEDGLGRRTSSLPTLTLFFHAFLRITVMLTQFLGVLIFPETDHWERDEFF